MITVELKRGVDPFKYSKLGKKWWIDNGVEIPRELLKNLKHKVKEVKEVKDGE